MKNKNRLSAKALLVLMIISFVVGLTACNGQLCFHQWSEWEMTEEATCTEPGAQERKCKLCGEIQTTSVESGHIPNEDDGDCTTAVTCSVCKEVMVEAYATHVGGSATCKDRAKCSICGMEYGGLSEHTPDHESGDCMTEIKCTDCGEVLAPASGNHTGGNATCTQKAQCEVCGKEYGELLEHGAESAWVKSHDSHYLVYTCCGEAVSVPEFHTMADGVCVVCGFQTALTADSVEITQGQTQITVAFSISDNPGIVGMLAAVQYDSEIFTLTDAQSGEAFEALTFTAPNDFENGNFMWDGLEIESDNIKDGAFLILTFEVSPDAPAGEYGITLDVTAYDNDLNSLMLTLEGAKIIIND